MIPIRELHWPDERDLALLHFEPAYHHARHYLVAALPGRLRVAVWNQRKGRGAALTRAARAAGCKIVCTEVWRLQSEAREKSWRKRGQLRLLCPLCLALGCDKVSHHLRDARIRERWLLKNYSEQSYRRWLAEREK